MNFLDLSFDIIMDIIIKLPPKETLNFILTNKYLYQNVINNEYFWKKKFIKNFDYVSVEDLDNWKIKYRNHSLYGLKPGICSSQYDILFLLQEQIKKGIVIWDMISGYEIIENLKKKFIKKNFHININKNMKIIMLTPLNDSAIESLDSIYMVLTP